eukprot:4431010-Amphidinium_carterae.1
MPFKDCILSDLERDQRWEQDPGTNSPGINSPTIDWWIAKENNSQPPPSPKYPRETNELQWDT